MGIVSWLNSRPEFHVVTARPRVRALADLVLGALPVVRTLPAGTRYRCRFLDSFAVADELFVQRVYDDGLPDRVNTFCDLGSNSGYFIALLRERYPGAALRGLAVDANADLVSETRWLLRQNGLDGVHAVHGLVGKATDAGLPGEFFLNTVGMTSSAFADREPNVPQKGPCRRVQVCYVDVEAIWLGVHGDRKCDLLKCDIEGGERDFLRADNPFLRRVKAIVAEVHLWIVPFADMDAELRAAGFVLRRSVELSPTRMTVVYDRSG